MDNPIETNTGAPRVNPLLDKIKLPGETFTLPSGGLFYNEGVLSPEVKNAEIYVQPMTTLDEITMKSPDLLFSGNAVRQVFARCIPQVLDAGRLLSKDVDFLLACLRKVSYGDEMTIEYKHDCKDAKEHSYVTDVGRFIRGAKRIDPTQVENDFTVTFQNGQVARFQPVLFQDYIDIMQALGSSSDDDSPEAIRDQMVKSLSGLIVDVDGITDREMVMEWLKQIPPRYITTINEKIDKVSTWGADFTASILCKDCGEKIEAEVPLNPLSFFT